MEGESKGSSSEGRPPNPNPNPNPLAAAYRPCFATDRVPLPCNKSLIRHPSLVSSSLFSFYFYFNATFAIFDFKFLIVDEEQGLGCFRFREL